MVHTTDGYSQKGDGCENKPGSMGTNDHLSRAETGRGHTHSTTPELWGMSVYATVSVQTVNIAVSMCTLCLFNPHVTRYHQCVMLTCALTCPLWMTPIKDIAGRLWSCTGTTYLMSYPGLRTATQPASPGPQLYGVEGWQMGTGYLCRVTVANAPSPMMPRVSPRILAAPEATSRICSTLWTRVPSRSA